MKRIHYVILLFVLAATAYAQTVPSQNNGAAPGAPQSAVSITKPAAGAKLQQDFVTITFALTNQSASVSETPKFKVTLDSQEPVSTTSTSQTFTGLTPGPHTVTVQLVDANGTPITGAQAAVQFSVVRKAAMLHGPQAIAQALRLNPSDIQVAKAPPVPQQVSAGGTLPLISVIGFGVLLGGIVSAMRSR